MVAPQTYLLLSGLAAVIWLSACSDSSPPDAGASPEAPVPAAEVMPAAPPPDAPMSVDSLDEPLPPFDEIGAELMVRSGILNGIPGTVTLYQIPDGEALLRFEGLRARSVAGVDVWLARSEEPGAAHVSLGALKARAGNFNYLVEAELRPEDYPAVVLYATAAATVLASATLH